MANLGIRTDASGTFGALTLGGVDKVTVGSQGIKAGSFAPGAITPNDLSQKITLGAAQTTTSGTFKDFSDIPSWATRITVMLVGVSVSGTSIPLLQLGDAEGFEVTGYTATTGYAANGASSSAVAQTTGFGLNGASSAATAVYATAWLHKLGAGNEWIFSISGSITGGTAAVISGGGSKTLSTTLDRLRITTVNGTDTFDAGSVNILYEG